MPKTRTSQLEKDKVRQDLFKTKMEILKLNNQVNHLMFENERDNLKYIRCQSEGHNWTYDDTHKDNRCLNCGAIDI